MVVYVSIRGCLRPPDRRNRRLVLDNEVQSSLTVGERCGHDRVVVRSMSYWSSTGQWPPVRGQTQGKNDGPPPMTVERPPKVAAERSLASCT